MPPRCCTTDRARRTHAADRSRAEESFAARLAECGQRLPAARLRLHKKRLKRGIASHRVELPAAGKRRGHGVALGDGAPKLIKSPFVLADVAEEPSFLEDRLRVVLNL